MHRQTRNAVDESEELDSMPCYRTTRNLACRSNLRLEEPPESDAPAVFLIAFKITDSQRSLSLIAIGLTACWRWIAPGA
jgi:hypothetical protein